MTTRQYIPEPLPPTEAPELVEVLEREHARLDTVIDERLNLIPATAEEVLKARDGWVRYFDAAVYDPGQGTGLYVRIGGAWLRVTVT